MQDRFTLHVVVACLLCAALVACNSSRSRGARLGGGGDDGRTGGGGILTNGDVCDQITPAACDYQIRCGYWEGTEADCVATTRYDCCSGDSCDWSATGDSAQVDACESAMRGLSCDSPVVPSACEDLFGSGPGDGGGDGTITLSDGGTSGLYGYCSYDGECPAEAEGCFLAYGPEDDASYFCTRRCDGDSDTTTCGSSAHCVSQPYDNPALCMQACSGDTDCSRELRCRTLASGRRACAP